MNRYEYEKGYFQALQTYGEFEFLDQDTKNLLILSPNSL